MAAGDHKKRSPEGTWNMSDWVFLTQGDRLARTISDLPLTCQATLALPCLVKHLPRCYVAEQLKGHSFKLCFFA
jgi:hypothetical protein